MKPSSDKNRNDINTKNYNDNGNNSNSSSNLYTSSQTNNVKIPASAWKVLALLSCIATMVMYAETMLIPAIPDLIKDFHVSYSMSSWILTAYLVAGAVMTPIAGKLSDIYGRKKILLIIMVIYAVGVSLSAFATNIYFMIVARAIQGIGMSMFPIAFGIVRDVFPREKNFYWSGSDHFYVCIWSCHWVSCRRDNHSKLWMEKYVLYNHSYCNCPTFDNKAIY